MEKEAGPDRFDDLSKRSKEMQQKGLPERRRVVDALKESEEGYRLLAATVDSMYLVDSECRYLFLNQSQRKRFGLPLEDIIGKRYSDFHSEEDSRDFARKVKEVFATGKETYQERRSKRDERYFLRTFSPAIKRSSGEVAEVIIVSKEITERKRLEEELKEHRDHLAQMVRERTVELETTNDRLRREIDERKHTEEALRQSERMLRIGDRINKVFCTRQDEEMYGEVLQIVLSVLKSKYGTFGYFNEDGSFFAPSVTRQIYWEKCNVPEREIIFQRGTFRGIWARAIEERKTLVSNEGPFNTPDGHIPIENTMVMPILFHDELIITIHIANKLGGYDEEDRKMLEAIVDQIAPVLYA